jgi:hypothetical protein
MSAYCYNSSALTQLNSAKRQLNSQTLINFLEECQEDAKIRTNIHNLTGQNYNEKDKILSLPLLLITTINSVISATTLFSEDSKSVKYIVFGMTQLITILMALQRFYGYGVKSEQNYNIGFLLQKIFRKIRYFLLQHSYSPKTSNELAEFVDDTQKSFDDILDKKILPPEKIKKIVIKERKINLKEVSMAREFRWEGENRYLQDCPRDKIFYSRENNQNYTTRRMTPRNNTTLEITPRDNTGNNQNYTTRRMTPRNNTTLEITPRDNTGNNQNYTTGGMTPRDNTENTRNKVGETQKKRPSFMSPRNTVIDHTDPRYTTYIYPQKNIPSNMEPPVYSSPRPISETLDDDSSKLDPPIIV